MQRRAEQLDPRRRQKLRDAGSAEGFFELRGEGEPGRDEGREVEGREDGEGVAGREEGVAGRGDGPRDRARDAEHAGEVAVFPEAEGHVDAGGGEEFGGAARGGCGWGVRDGAADGVDGVGGGVGAEVEG